jgi:hypothetical protein
MPCVVVEGLVVEAQTSLIQDPTKLGHEVQTALK